MNWYAGGDLPSRAYLKGSKSAMQHHNLWIVGLLAYGSWFYKTTTPISVFIELIVGFIIY
ncbi:MAG: hypothetical protein WB443_08460 [Nitrososphaeraceae archaeon]